LEGGGSADSGIESQVLGFAGGRPCLDVASAFSLGVGVTAPASHLAHHLVKRGIQPARLKDFPRLYLLAALPPVGILFPEYFAGRRFYRRFVEGFILLG